MSTLLVIARAVHFASALLVLGELVFATAIAGPGWTLRRRSSSGQDGTRYRRLAHVGIWSLGLSVGASIVWLMLAASTMSGLPLLQAMHRDTLLRVLLETEFGRLWIIRIGIAIPLGVLLYWIGCPRDRAVETRVMFLALPIGVLYVASLAWAGHAAAAQDPERQIHLVSDVVHLVAAAAWLGALPALIASARRESPEGIVDIARRFSQVGSASVAMLALSGIINAWFLIGSFRLLVETDYGRVLCAKIALFLLMVAFALVNRLRLTLRLSEPSGRARDALRRNAIAETALGIGVLILVALLGTMVPAAHQHHHPMASPAAPLVTAERGPDLAGECRERARDRTQSRMAAG